MHTYLFGCAKKTYLALVPLTKELIRMMVSDMPGHLIRRLNQMSTRIFSQGMQDAGQDLTPVQFAALDAVHSHPGLDQAGIAARIAYEKATIGGVIDRLEQKGLLTRSISTRDRRALEVSLTRRDTHWSQQVRAVRISSASGKSNSQEFGLVGLFRSQHHRG